MIVLDVSRKFPRSRLWPVIIWVFNEQSADTGRIVKTNHPDLERAVKVAAEEAAIAKRVLFLSCSQKVFHLWHVVHKPFSYNFALLAVIHVALVLMMGYF